MSVPLGTYTVTPSKPNLVFKPVNCLLELTCTTNATVTVGPTVPDPTNLNFSVVYDIAGHIMEGTKGLSGVQVTVQDFPQTAVTDANGAYLLAGFRSAQYSLAATKSGYTSLPTPFSP